MITVSISYPSTRPPLWRVLHDVELPPEERIHRPNLPEMQTLYPNHYSEFSRNWQILSKEMNPLFSPRKWTVVYGTKLWITNYQGFEDSSDPRANYITGENLRSGNPRVEALTCGGNVLKGEVVGEMLKIECLDVNGFVPTKEWVLARPWLFTYAVTVDGRGQPRRFPQGEQPNGEVIPFKHPFICNPNRFGGVYIPLWAVERWNTPSLPDPYTVYRV